MAGPEVLVRGVEERAEAGEAGVRRLLRAVVLHDPVPVPRHARERRPRVALDLHEARVRHGVHRFEERAQLRQLDRARAVQQKADPPRRIGRLVPEREPHPLQRVPHRMRIPVVDEERLGHAMMMARRNDDRPGR
jgi:hypothetical protein